MYVFSLVFFWRNFGHPCVQLLYLKFKIYIFTIIAHIYTDSTLTLQLLIWVLGNGLKRKLGYRVEIKSAGWARLSLPKTLSMTV